MGFLKDNAVEAIVLGGIVGTVLAFVGSFLTGYTSAIAIPESLLGLSRCMMIFWDLVVVQFLGFGLITLIAIFLANRIFSINVWLFAVATLIICELTLVAMSSYRLAVYTPHVIVMILCALSGAYLAHNKRINR